MSIATIIAFVLRYRRILIYIGAAIAVLLALWGLYSHVWHKGYDAADQKWKAAQRAAEAKAAADSWALVGNINEIDTSTQQKVEKIRAVPRDKPRTIAIEVARDLPCLRVPDRLLNSTNQYTRDLAAASGHRIVAVPAADGTEGREP